MIKDTEILFFLRPDGGWVIYEDNFETAIFLECDPVSNDEFEKGKIAYENWKIEQEKIKEAERQAVLEKLGLTADEAAALLG